MSTIKNVAILGASGNFGTPITTSLLAATFNLTIITRSTSTTTHPPNIPIIRIPYNLKTLTQAFSIQDAVICVVGPGGIPLQKMFVDAAVAAKVHRFVIDDFGWGLTTKGLTEFEEIHKQRREGWDYAAEKAREYSWFTWTGLSTGNPIDWAMKKFPMMGYDVQAQKAIIYDEGTQRFTGTTLEGIGQAVVGTLQNPSATVNRFLAVQSINTCQNELLEAFEKVTEKKWEVSRQTSEDLIASGKEDFAAGNGIWRLKLAVATLYDVGQGRGMVAPSRKESDAGLLGVRAESAEEIVAKLLR
ncbi:NAD(P)-binding protein [Aureobasidium sp. EXF-10728]|nr:NAD(P)-binding protein [Aureobasidium sp. EXF-10728]